ncbi:MAG: ATP-binding cassette domain-containing protein [Methylobacterium sp.]|nr:ATP-binding cassette domain-containing protein [Methylobacterium sp.]
MVASGPQVVFRARGLTKTYGSGPNAVHALRDVDLDISEGEFIVLLGPSGSGKSTLLNILGGLDAPTSGKARFREHELTGATEAELTAYRREHVSFVFQFYNLIPSLNVAENVRLVAEIAADPMPVEEAVALVGLSPRAAACAPVTASGES